MRTPHNKILTREDEQRIADLYIDGKTTGEIHKEFKHKVKQRKSILDALKRLGIERRDKHDYVQVKHNAFEKIGSEPAAYFLGLMIADGWVQESTNEVGIQLNEEDKDILEKFNEWLESPLPLLETRGMWRITIRSPYIKRDLAKYGVEPTKTFKSFLPHLDKQWMPHLFRGILDGDGTIHTTKAEAIHIKFHGTYQLCAAIRQYLMDELDINQTEIVSIHSIYGVTWTNQEDVQKLKEYLWPKDIECYLERKKI